jgi:tetratricopeptide (TPR) repeat protein
MDFCFRGWAWLYKGSAPNELAVARSYFEQAVAIDPSSAFGLIGIAAVDTTVALNLLSEDRVGRLAAAEAALTKALSLDHENAVANLMLGVVQMHTKRVPEGVRQRERALVGVGIGKRQGRSDAPRWADRAEQISVVIALIGGLSRSGSAPGPLASQAASIMAS